MKRFFAFSVVFIIVFVVLLPAFAEEGAATIDLTGIITSVLGVIVSFVLSWFAGSVVPALKKWLAAKTTNEQRKELNGVVRQLVYAAEQVFGAKCGKEKFQYVLEGLKDRGFTADTATIEAAVMEMNERFFTDILDEITCPQDEEEVETK